MKILERVANEEVQWKRLGEIAEIGTGKSNAKDEVENGEYPFYVRSKFIKRINKFEFDEEAIIIPGEGGIGEIFHYVNGKYALHQRAYRIHLTIDKIKTKFLYYFMISEFKRYIEKSVVSSTVSSIRKPMIENFQIPIPSLELQEEIVEILDKFSYAKDELVKELGKECDLREKQYNYYLEKLLDFGIDFAERKKEIYPITGVYGAYPQAVA